MAPRPRRCTNMSVEPGVLAVCDQSCARAEDCSGRGADFTCEAGYCRGPVLPGSPELPQPGGAGQGSGGSGSPPIFFAGAGSTPVPVGAGGSGEPLPDACSLLFDPGTCDALISVFAFIDGTCQKATYGGCDGNANRFSSLEQCQSVCELRPSVNRCNDGRVEREICLGCGPVGGCGEKLLACAQPCDAETACASQSFVCSDGVCQQTRCY